MHFCDVFAGQVRLTLYHVFSMSCHSTDAQRLLVSKLTFDRVLRVFCVTAELHRVCAEGQATAALYPEGPLPAPYMVVRDVTRLRVWNLCDDHGQHLGSGNEGKDTCCPDILVAV